RGIRASQRSRVSWESTRGPRTVRRISVDLPLPGSPVTTTTSCGAKSRACGPLPARPRRSRTAGSGSDAPGRPAGGEAGAGTRAGTAAAGAADGADGAGTTGRWGGGAPVAPAYAVVLFTVCPPLGPGTGVPRPAGCKEKVMRGVTGFRPLPATGRSQPAVTGRAPCASPEKGPPAATPECVQ